MSHRERIAFFSSIAWVCSLMMCLYWMFSGEELRVIIYQHVPWWAFSTWSLCIFFLNIGISSFSDRLGLQALGLVLNGFATCFYTYLIWLLIYHAIPYFSMDPNHLLSLDIVTIYLFGLPLLLITFFSFACTYSFAILFRNISKIMKEKID